MDFTSVKARRPFRAGTGQRSSLNTQILFSRASGAIGHEIVADRDSLALSVTKCSKAGAISNYAATSTTTPSMAGYAWSNASSSTPTSFRGHEPQQWPKSSSAICELFVGVNNRPCLATKHPDAAAPAPSGRVIADERAKERLYCFRFRPTATEGLAARPGSWRKIAGRHQNWRDAVAAKHGK